MRRQLANTQEYEEIFVDREIKFTADNGTSTVIPLHKEWNTLSIQLSGGLDSALLLYLSTKAIQEQNLDIKIQPITFFIPKKIKNVVVTKSIIEKVKELTKCNFINDGIVFDIPMSESGHENNKKNRFIELTLRDLLVNGKTDFDLNGNTKNPPEEIRINWPNDEYRQKNRDAAVSIYTSRRSASPHYGIDKYGIINLYYKYGILESLAPLTCSCDENVSVLKETQRNVPCKNCWWCLERQWGFDSNKLKDPARTVTWKQYKKLF
jgi:hypothetical protein